MSKWRCGFFHKDILVVAWKSGGGLVIKPCTSKHPSRFATMKESRIGILYLDLAHES